MTAAYCDEITGITFLLSRLPINPNHSHNQYKPGLDDENIWGYIEEWEYLFQD